jgi:hypothetical protein
MTFNIGVVSKKIVIDVDVRDEINASTETLI